MFLRYDISASLAQITRGVAKTLNIKKIAIIGCRLPPVLKIAQVKSGGERTNKKFQWAYDYIFHICHHPRKSLVPDNITGFEKNWEFSVLN